MNITIIGAGYVGLVSAACFAEFGFNVVCIDKDKEKIKALKKGKITIYEPGLEDIVLKNIKAKRLSFHTESKKAISHADAIFIAVGTPERRGDGHADIKYVTEAAAEIAESLEGYTVIITKSTVPVGTGRIVERIVEKIIAETNPNAKADVASNPEFLREGSAINDFMRPDRVIVGAESKAAKKVMKNLYRPLFLRETPVVFTSLETAEMIKYAANAFLAVKISYINQIADLCEAAGADVHKVAKGMGLDKRIGDKFLHPGPGYGGSCFPKDTKALVKIAEGYNREVSIVKEVVRYNKNRKIKMAERIIRACPKGQNIDDCTVAILGLAFKPETDDMRQSPAIKIISELLQSGAKIKAYDPAAMEQAKAVLPDAVVYASSAQEAIEGADILAIITEWNEFRALTPETLKSLMKGKAIVDLRNIFDFKAMEKAGFDYQNIGRAGRDEDKS